MARPPGRPRRNGGDDRAENDGGAPDRVDIHVGACIRMRRILLGLNQQALARKLGLTFQQIQKYENGTNRVSASRLIGIAEALGVTAGYFFRDLEDSESPASEQEILWRQ